jgi:hypothetical protein
MSSRRLEEDVAEERRLSLVARREAVRIVAGAVGRADGRFVRVEVPDWCEKLLDGAEGEVEGAWKVSQSSAQSQRQTKLIQETERVPAHLEWHRES